MKKLILVVGCLALLGGCASSGNQKLKAETEASVSQKIQEGKTTKAEVRTLFGSPGTTSFTDSGMEMWKYLFVDVSADAISYVPIVGAFGGSSSGTQKELTILFDTDNVVKRYSMSVSDIETKTGLMNM